MVLAERRKANSPDMPNLVTEMMDLTEEHIARTQQVLIPGLEHALTAEERADLGSQIDRADTVITTHPHPHLLSLGPISRWTTRLAARFDRLRDRTVDNRHRRG
jgi:hypothetical protein